MKNTFGKGIALLAIVSFVLFGCSSDNDAQSSNSSVRNDSSFFMRNSGEVYEGFEDVMTDLYADNQTVEATVEYKVDGGTYLVSEVTLNSNLQGYFLENPSTKEVVYLSEDVASGTLSQWSLDNGVIVKDVYDLTLDPNYATDGFSPDTILTGKRRFWGTSYSQGPCNQTTGLAQLYVDHYVFGIRDHHEPAVDVVTGGDIFEPCGMH